MLQLAVPSKTYIIVPLSSSRRKRASSKRTLGISEIFLLLGSELENVIEKLSPVSLSMEKLNEAVTSFTAELCHESSLKLSLTPAA